MLLIRPGSDTQLEKSPLATNDIEADDLDANDEQIPNAGAAIGGQ